MESGFPLSEGSLETMAGDLISYREETFLVGITIECPLYLKSQ